MDMSRHKKANELDVQSMVYLKMAGYCLSSVRYWTG